MHILDNYLHFFLTSIQHGQNSVLHIFPKKKHSKKVETPGGKKPKDGCMAQLLSPEEDLKKIPKMNAKCHW